MALAREMFLLDLRQKRKTYIKMQKRPIVFIKLFIIFVIVVLFGFYFFHQSKAFLLGASIVVNYPKDGQTLVDSLILIKGKALNCSSFFINGQKVLTDNFGNFEKNLILARGYNIIELSAQDKFERLINKRIEVVLK